MRSTIVRLPWHVSGTAMLALSSRRRRGAGSPPLPRHSSRPLGSARPRPTRSTPPRRNDVSSSRSCSLTLRAAHGHQVRRPSAPSAARHTAGTPASACTTAPPHGRHRTCRSATTRTHGTRRRIGDHESVRQSSTRPGVIYEEQPTRSTSWMSHRPRSQPLEGARCAASEATRQPPFPCATQAKRRSHSAEVLSSFGDWLTGLPPRWARIACTADCPRAVTISGLMGPSSRSQ